MDGKSSISSFSIHKECSIYGVVNGKLHKKHSPTAADDNWLGTSTLVGTGGWNYFQILFFMSDGDLYGVHQGKFYKRSPPTHSQDDWLGYATLIGSGDWSVFNFPMAPLLQR